MQISTDSSSSHSTAIGAGVGIPLGLAALGLIAFLLYRDRRHKKQLLDLQSNRSAAAGDGNNMAKEVSGLDPTAPDRMYELNFQPEGIGRAGQFELGGTNQAQELPSTR